MAAFLAVLLLLFALLRKFLHALCAQPSHARPVACSKRSVHAGQYSAPLAIGLYVGAEVSIGSIMINFLSQPNILGLPFDDAGGYLANFYWGGALCGRLVGTALLTRIRATRMLGGCGIAAGLLCLTVLAAQGPVAGYRCACNRLFQLDHVPDDLRDHARAVGRVAGLDFRASLPCDLRRRLVAAGGGRDRRSNGAQRILRRSARRLSIHRGLRARREGPERQTCVRAAGERLPKA